MPLLTRHFLLVPDSGAARRLKRKLANDGGCQGVMVGTWPELLAQAASAYLIPVQLDTEQTLRDALSNLTDAFWAESYVVAPDETSVAVIRALRELVSGADPAVTSRARELNKLQKRTRRHVEDLYRLLDAAEGALPDDLGAIRACLEASAGRAMRLLHVHYVEQMQPLDLWRMALIEKLNKDSATADNPNYRDLIQATLAPDLSGDPSAIRRLQSDLFEPVSQAASQDDSLQWVGARDALEEVEIAAGMIQSLLKRRKSLRPTDIALLIPSSLDYTVALADVFPLAGLQLSGLPCTKSHRDLGKEAVFLFLHTRSYPAPAMATAALLANPLMPWPSDVGAGFAQKVMDGDYGMRKLTGSTEEASKMLSLLKRRGDTTPKGLQSTLRRFAGLLDSEGVDEVHLAEAQHAVGTVLNLLQGQQEILWVALRQAVLPGNIRGDERTDFNQEGIAVWLEGQEPWRPAKILLVLGFSGGHYPAPAAVSPVFGFDDYKALDEVCGLSVIGPEQRVEANRACFKRQLGAVDEHICFLVPRRNAAGDSIQPSDSLVFMQQLFGTEHLIRDVSSSEDRSKIKHLALAKGSTPEPPRELVVADLHFDRNLLSLRQTDDGDNKPESPSGLETLMISPLGWLLRRMYAEPMAWAAEAPDMGTYGTIAHRVFEALFTPDRPVPTPAKITSLVPDLLIDAVNKIAPYLTAPQWQVELRNLVTDTTKAAVEWQKMLKASGAEIIGEEVWLKGKLGDIAIHGAADLLIQDANNRVFIVDYKRSGSGKRRKRMQAGFDSQAELYRTMLKTGGRKDDEVIPLGNVAPGVVYYLMMDQQALSDVAISNVETMPSWEWMQDDVSGEAMALIQKRVADLQCGLIRLNRDTDKHFFDNKAHTNSYALDISPLITRYTLPDEQEQ